MNDIIIETIIEIIIETLMILLLKSLLKSLLNWLFSGNSATSMRGNADHQVNLWQIQLAIAISATLAPLGN